MWISDKYLRIETLKVQTVQEVLWYDNGELDLKDLYKK